MKNLIIISALIVLTFGKVSGQWNFSLSTDHEYNDNPFHTTIPEQTFISSIDLGLERNMNALSLGYYGSFVNFNNNSPRNFYWHQLAMWKDNDESAYGVYGEQRIGRDIYTYFDYWDLTAYYRQSFNWNDFYFFINPNVSITRYKEISILDNFKGTFNAQLNRGFDFGATVIVGGSFNYKKYLDPTQRGTYTYLDENNVLVTENYVDRNISSLSQITSYLRVAQSITESTGLAAQFTNRSIISGVASFAKDLNFVYGDESEIFDDPVNTEGNSFSVELTQLLFDDMEIKTGFHLNYKNYPSQGLYDELGNYTTDLMRADVQKVFNLSIKKRIETDFLGSSNLTLGLNYQSISNSSNSYWFNYRNNALSFNIGLEL